MLTLVKGSWSIVILCIECLECYHVVLCIECLECYHVITSFLKTVQVICGMTGVCYLAASFIPRIYITGWIISAKIYKNYIQDHRTDNQHWLITPTSHHKVPSSVPVNIHINIQFFSIPSNWRPPSLETTYLDFLLWSTCE